MGTYAKVNVTTLNDAQSGGLAVLVLPADAFRKRAVFVTDGVVFIKPGDGTNLVATGYALGVASAYGGGFEINGGDAIYAVRYGTATLRVWVESYDRSV